MSRRAGTDMRPAEAEAERARSAFAAAVEAFDGFGDASAVREKLATQLMEPVGSSPDDLRARMEGEIARWAPVIKAANVKIN